MRTFLAASALAVLLVAAGCSSGGSTCETTTCSANGLTYTECPGATSSEVDYGFGNGASCTCDPTGGASCDMCTQQVEVYCGNVAGDGGAPDATTSTDASVDADACSKHLGKGFTSAVPAGSSEPNIGVFGAEVSMALDENDDPMFAYLTYPGDGVTTLSFTRWDACAGAFTKPLVVDTATYGIGDGPGDVEVALAYDASTKELGIAYTEASAPTSAGEGNTLTMLATMKSGAKAFTTEVVSAGLDAMSGTSFPALAMAGGVVYVAYNQGNYMCDAPGASSCTGVVFLTSTTKKPAGGSKDAGPPPPHYFTSQVIPYEGHPAQSQGASVSVAVDSSGKVGVAFYEPSSSVSLPNETTMLYWRNDLASAVVVTSSNDVHNAFVDLTLRFEGTKPRIAGHLVGEASAPYDMIFVASDDGTTWSAPVHIPRDNGASTGRTSSLAMDGEGNGAVVTSIAAGDPKCADPEVARTSTDGTAWAVCTSDIAKGHTFTDHYLNAAYGASRLAGKLVIAFQNGPTTASASQPNGIWVYESP
jgi:hypothetical protein